jgi:hypothetical protein
MLLVCCRVCENHHYATRVSEYYDFAILDPSELETRARRSKSCGHDWIQYTSMETSLPIQPDHDGASGLELHESLKNIGRPNAESLPPCHSRPTLGS